MEPQRQTRTGSGGTPDHDLRLVPLDGRDRVELDVLRDLLGDLGSALHQRQLGALEQVAAGEADADLRLWSVTDPDGVVGCLVVLPGRPADVALHPRTQLDALVVACRRAGIEVQDLAGEAELVGQVAQRWATAIGGSARLLMGMHVLACERLDPRPSVPPGTWRRANGTDRDVVLRYLDGFYREALPNHLDGLASRLEALARRLEGEHGLHAWVDDGRVVSIASIGLPAAGGERIATVYTPPELRGRGYAGALVAALTEDAFARGRRFVVLETDVTNPASNSIYERLGYRRIGQAASWRVSSAGARSHGNDGHRALSSG
jgi:ribosomal protein S18 acetylase RimI-like enzyme